MPAVQGRDVPEATQALDALHRIATEAERCFKGLADGSILKGTTAVRKIHLDARDTIRRIVGDELGDDERGWGK